MEFVTMENFSSILISCWKLLGHFWKASAENETNTQASGHTQHQPSHNYVGKTVDYKAT